MKKTVLTGVFFVMSTLNAVAQTTYDSSTLVDTNSTSTSTSTVNTNNTSTSTSTNNNNSTINSTSTNTNNNVNTSTSTSTNTNYNVNSGTQTFNNNNVSTSTNNNNNVNNSTSTNTNIQQGDMTNRNINDSKIDQTLRQPPPTAIAPAMMSGGNNDLCTTGVSGAVQTQILGVSSGGTVRDLNCERLKNAKTLFDMGMKVAAVATLCQDRRVFDAMWNAGTPCPFEGIIGESAKVAWTNNPDKIPKNEEPRKDDFYKKTTFGAVLGAFLFKFIGF